MIPRSRFSRLAIVVAIACLSSTAIGFQATATRPTELQQRLLYADLWMQTSAEYVACCLQTYHWAGDQVEQDLKFLHNNSTAGSEDSSKPGELPPAVVMDLDETVLDNATLQTHLYDSGQNYSDKEFSQFVSEHRDSIRIVPGAKDFIAHAESLGITVIYITNREEPLREATIESLHNGGINTAGLEDANGVRLLMQRHGESIKKPRRDLARAKYNVIAYFGDQLGDFSDEFAATKENTAPNRVELAYKYRDLWGTRWFALPNPVYGQWQQVLRGDPEQYLRRAEK